MLRILLADDHSVVRRIVRNFVQSESGWEVCAEATTGREAVVMTAKEHPDVVILDLSMPDLNGLQAASLILNGRFSYEELAFVFRPNPGVEPMFVHCDKCGNPILACHTTPPALESTTISNNISRCKHCGEPKKWSKADLWTLKGIKGQFSDEIIEKS